MAKKTGSRRLVIDLRAINAVIAPKLIQLPKVQAELDFLKNQLLTEPILQPFNPQQDLMITCDGSTLGYGWTLLQRGADNALHVVAYGAQATSKASANYTAAELELLALSMFCYF